jgi:hypothetical protein
VQNLDKVSISLQSRIGGVMVSMLASIAVDRWFEPRSGQTKDYKIGLCCFSAKHTVLRRKSKDWLAQNQDLSEGTCLSAVVSVSKHYKKQTKPVNLAQSWTSSSSH